MYVVEKSDPSETCVTNRIPSMNTLYMAEKREKKNVILNWYIAPIVNK